MGSVNHERLLSLIGCIRGAVLELDGNGVYLNAWVDDPELLVAPVEQIIGKTVIDLLGPVTGAALLERVRRVYATGIPERYEYPLVIRGKPTWFMSDFKRVTAEGGHTVLLFRHDISEKKEAEAALQLSEERYRLAAKATNDILYDWDIATNTVTWGPGMNRVFGYEQPTTNEWSTRFHPDDHPRVMAEIQRVVFGGEKSWQLSYRARKSDGTYAELLDRGFIVRDDVGNPTRLVGSLADVTEMHRLQAQLVQADRLVALGTLAAGVGHEINNPLCFVIGNIELAIEAGPFAQTEDARVEEEDAKSALRDAREGAARIVDIVKGLRLFSRSEATITKTVAVESVLEQAVKIGENEIRHRARLVRDFRPTPPVNVSESQLGQVCLNLIVNATQAVPLGSAERHEIRLSSGADALGRAFFSVSDTGTGIQPEHIGRIFDPFFTTKAPGAGTGIGLSVCMSIVQSMGGELSVTSVPNEHTVFTVTLPAADSSNAAA